MDEDIQSLLKIRREKQRRLRTLEIQAARQGTDTPPHILVEIETLRGALGLVDAAVASPLTASVVEELGQTGRYLATDTQLRTLREAIALIGRRLDDAIALISDRIDASDAESRMWRNTHRQIILIIGGVVVVILVVVAVIVTYIFTKGSV